MKAKMERSRQEKVVHRGYEGPKGGIQAGESPSSGL